MSWKFKVGDRVKRISKNDILRHGVVVEVYEGYKDYLNQTRVLYAVKWDDTGTIEKGYMEIANGLTSETTKLD